MKRVFKYKKGEMIDGTEEAFNHLFDLIQGKDCRCPQTIKITIISEKKKGEGK